jgi:hypothetical protein
MTESGVSMQSSQGAKTLKNGLALRRKKFSLIKNLRKNFKTSRRNTRNKNQRGRLESRGELSIKTNELLNYKKSNLKKRT